MKPFSDLRKQQFGLHVVLEYVDRTPSGHARWLTECLNCKCRSIRHGVNIKRCSKVSGGCRNCSGKPKGYMGLHQLFTQYKLRANKIGRIFNLSIEQFQTVTSSNCHYCGREPYQIKNSGNKNQISTWGIYQYNGIDRKDNSKGYIIENCLPCCGICNQMKGSMLYKDFVDWLDVASTFRKNRNGDKVMADIGVGYRVKIQILCGMIAAGKSSYCKLAAKKGMLILNDDAIVNMLHADDYTLYSTDLKVLYKSVENHVIGTSLAMGRSVIVDRGLNMSLAGRRRWLALAQSFDVPCEAIHFKNDGPEEHARRRTQSDGRGHTWEYWLRVAELHNSLYIPPTKEEGFDAIYDIGFDEIQQGKVIL